MGWLKWKVKKDRGKNDYHFFFYYLKKKKNGIGRKAKEDLEALE